MKFKLGKKKREEELPEGKLKYEYKQDTPTDESQNPAKLHDPILKAVQERQPWEDMTFAHPVAAITPSSALRDVFGQPITNPDISNPARSREERPLDTIRSFEYSTSGDERIKDAMETQHLGFRPRQDFDPMPRFETNPYSNNVISFGDPNAPPDSTDTIQHSQYFLEDKERDALKKKKKGGMFRKKKNN